MKNNKKLVIGFLSLFVFLGAPGAFFAQELDQILEKARFSLVQI